jgi:chromosome segregation ATPase
MTPDPASIEAEVRKRHSAEWRGRAVCATCGISEPWPCDAIRAADEIVRLRRNIATIEANCAAIEEDFGRIQDKLTHAYETIDTFAGERDSLRAQNEALVRELAQLRADTEPYADETGEHALLARMRGLRSERDALAAEALDLRAERDALRKVAEAADRISRGYEAIDSGRGAR